MKPGYLLYVTEEEASMLAHQLDLIDTGNMASSQALLVATLQARLHEAPLTHVAVEHVAGFMSATEPYSDLHPENLKGHAERVLEAAFSPTETSEDA